MLFPAFTTTLLLTFATLSAVTAIPAPAPEPIPEPAPIPPELQPIIAAKNNLAGTATDYNDPRFNSTLTYSNGVVMSQKPMAYIAVVSVTAGTLLSAFI